MKLYRVKDWNSNYENNKSRERERCGFVCIPNSQDGLGFSRVMAHKNGASIYGIWCLLLGALSRQGKHRDGWLTDDGHATGKAWDVSDLALIWRRTEKEVEEALFFLASPQVAWLEIIQSTQVVDNEQSGTEQTEGARPVPDQCTTSALEENRNEEKRRERKETTAPVGLGDFETFWSRYPKKTSKANALREWNKIRPDINDVMCALDRQIKWREDAKDGDFRPPWKDPERWIKAQCWHDVVEAEKPNPQPSAVW